MTWLDLVGVVTKFCNILSPDVDDYFGGTFEDGTRMSYEVRWQRRCCSVDTSLVVYNLEDALE